MQVHQLEARYPYKPTGEMIDISGKEYRRSFMIATEPDKSAEYEEIRMFFTDDAQAVYFGCLKQGRPKGPPKTKIQGRIYQDYYNIIEQLAEIGDTSISHLTAVIMQNVLSCKSPLFGFDFHLHLVSDVFLPLSQTGPHKRTALLASQAFAKWIRAGGIHAVNAAITSLESDAELNNLVVTVAQTLQQWAESNKRLVLRDSTAQLLAHEWIRAHHALLLAALYVVRMDLEPMPEIQIVMSGQSNVTGES